MRPSGRELDSLRDISFEMGYAPYAEGSCLIKCGNTHVLCTATIEEKIPPFLKGKGEGWVTAEYGMLPRSTHTRIDRDVKKGQVSGRSQEIQRLIGRSLRSIVELRGLADRQIIIDCDVIRADGGTRTASITGGFLALYQACVEGAKMGKIPSMPIKDQVAAISCGIYKGEVILDLDYAEDSNAEADANFIMTPKGKIIEVQGTAEKQPFTQEQFAKMMELAQKGIKILGQKQSEIMAKLF